VRAGPAAHGRAGAGEHDGAAAGGPPRDEAAALPALIRAVAARDRRAFESLYDRLAPAIGRYVYRLLHRPELVDEVVNDVMLAVWQGAARYDAAAGRVTTWVFSIAHHLALKAWTRTRRHADAESLDDEEGPAAIEVASLAAGGHGPERALEGRQLGRALEGALARLPLEQRAVIELAFGEQCDYDEIAAITGSPVNTVKTRVFYARQRLARLLGEAGFDDR
jgi:RNA polymerase sigma-70 factor (ECF subfamily)